MSVRRRSGSAGWSVALALALAPGLWSCSFGAPDPIPLEGPTPHTILVLPIKPPDVPGDVGPALLATIGPALRDRGYYPIPIGLGHSQLEAAGLLPDRQYPVERYAQAATEIGADAFLSIRVEEWDAVYAPTLVHLTHDIGYRLWDAGTGELLWELRSHARWDWTDEQRYDSRGADLESYLEPAKRVQPSSTYRDDVEAARAVHRRALALLPVGDVR